MTHRIVLVASSTKWSAKDYGINDRDLLCVEEDVVERKLKKMGGAATIRSRPRLRASPTRERGTVRASRCSTRLSSRTLGSPSIIVKALRIQGTPILTRECLEHSLAFVQKHNIRAQVKKYRFEQNELNSAWTSLEQGRSFDDPLIVME